jgi:N utilization substance protein B
LIQKAVDKWKLLRMAAIDRNIIRVSAYEILFRDDIPDAVSINEALEIAKRFSTAESAAFINGILDRISKDFKIKK